MFFVFLIKRSRGALKQLSARELKRRQTTQPKGHARRMTATSGTFITFVATHVCTYLLKRGEKCTLCTNFPLQHQSCFGFFVALLQPALNLSLPASVIHEPKVSFRPYVLVESCFQSHTHTHTYS